MLGPLTAFLSASVLFAAWPTAVCVRSLTSVEQKNADVRECADWSMGQPNLEGLSWRGTWYLQCDTFVNGEHVPYWCKPDWMVFYVKEDPTWYRMKGTHFAQNGSLVNTYYYHLKAEGRLRWAPWRVHVDLQLEPEEQMGTRGNWSTAKTHYVLLKWRYDSDTAWTKLEHPLIWKVGETEQDHESFNSLDVQQGFINFQFR
eukprot:TRINITY_DN80176_c0_g1_i1.p1 TRINITY_DN80176_c0_g1~~TRINITY_DN80176_c0_g1_i1.p1  ORF type:complete len:201 (-),score=14.50 TRINITY_DN80176_c0_g1_i1:35-637(-)